LAGFCKEQGADENLSWDLVCAADEIIANVIEHSQASWVEWNMDIEPASGKARLEFRDNGAEFDVSKAAREAEKAAGDGTQRHLGLLLVKSVADGLDYRRQDGRVNVLELAASPKARQA
jgi:anti-sigma regulatory factor (Ser/Thr protein kinase)